MHIRRSIALSLLRPSNDAQVAATASFWDLFKAALSSDFFHSASAVWGRHCRLLCVMMRVECLGAPFDIFAFCAFLQLPSYPFVIYL